MIAASLSPIQINTGLLVSTLTDYEIDGQRVMDLRKEKDRKKLDEILAIFRNIDTDRPCASQIESSNHILSRTKGLNLITDDNMITESAK